MRAQDEAREMGHRTVQVEHLLLGLASDQDGISGRVFADFGLTIEPIRELQTDSCFSCSIDPTLSPIDDQSAALLRTAIYE